MRVLAPFSIHPPGAANMTPLADILSRSPFNSVILSVVDTAGARIVDLKKVVLFSGGILLVTLFLALWQWFDRRSRDPDQNDEDRDFFHRQDRRRHAGVALMVALALAIPAHSLLLSVLPGNSILRYSPWSGLIFAVIWLVVCVLVVFLLVLALFDLLATRRYARRHRRALAHERSKLMLDILHRSGSSDSGRRASEEKSEQ
jgi:hypothetical protein